MTRALAGLILLLAGAAVARTPYQQGVAAFESGNLADAESWLARVDLRAEPHAAYLLGVTAERRRAWADAIAGFDRYLAAPGADLAPSARAHRAYCLASAGRLADALPYLKVAPAATDRPTAFLLGYADLLIARQGKLDSDRQAAGDRAVTRFTKLANRGDDAEAQNALGLAHLALAALSDKPAGRTPHLAAADAAFTRAAALSPEGDPIHDSAMRGRGKVRDLQK